MTNVPRTIRNIDDVLRLLDAMFDAKADRWTDRGSSWWDGFYAERDRAVPFFKPCPDESLVRWHQDGRLQVRTGSRALDLGCGPGRNAVWLAEQGYEVDALDLSPAALDWGRERAARAGVDVNFVRADIFEWQVPETPYDLVYDSGCFHHLPPHRRISYRALIEQALAPGAGFGLACFASGAMGSEASDEELYRDGHLAGGLAYSDEDLRGIFGWLTLVELRRMRDTPPESELFGEPFLWAGLFRR
jgi:SAM-dependent methyltransferase